jgi:hypothetical protein
MPQSHETPCMWVLHITDKATGAEQVAIIKKQDTYNTQTRQLDDHLGQEIFYVKC